MIYFQNISIRRIWLPTITIEWFWWLIYPLWTVQAQAWLILYLLEILGLQWYDSNSQQQWIFADGMECKSKLKTIDLITSECHNSLTFWRIIWKADWKHSLALWKLLSGITKSGPKKCYQTINVFHTLGRDKHPPGFASVHRLFPFMAHLYDFWSVVNV